MSGQYLLGISQLGYSLLNQAMGINDLRRVRVRRLIDEHFDGVDARFASRIKRSPTQVARWFMDNKHRRNIGEKIARDIEKQLGLRGGWLDSDQDNNHTAQQPLGVYNSTKERQDHLLDLFDHLSEEQQLELLDELQAKKISNEAIFKQLSGKLRHVTKERAAEKLPPAPNSNKAKT